MGLTSPSPSPIPDLVDPSWYGFLLHSDILRGHKSVRNPFLAVDDHTHGHSAWRGPPDAATSSLSSDESFMVVLVTYSAWICPFEVAFLNAAPRGGLCNSIVDIFAVDIVLIFFVAYVDSRTQLLVQDQKKIALLKLC